jgi:hypothetical protein
MGGGCVVRVGGEVLGGQAPVRRDDSLLRDADDLHLRAADEQVEVPARIAEELAERRGVGRPGGEDEPLVAVGARLDEVQRVAVQAAGGTPRARTARRSSSP